MKRFFKVILSMVVVLSMLPTYAMAAAPDKGVQPAMTILESGGITIHSGAKYGMNIVEVTVTTSALAVVDKVYHIVTVYKNGELVMDRKEYAAYNTGYLSTAIDFDAKDGDIFEVVVEHCAKDGSIVESKPNSAVGDY